MSEPFCACDWADECGDGCDCVCHGSDALASTQEEDVETGAAV